VRRTTLAWISLVARRGVTRAAVAEGGEDGRVSDRGIAKRFILIAGFMVSRSASEHKIYMYHGQDALPKLL
jgi:hypothetical protein